MTPRELLIPKPGDRVRVIEVGPTDAFRDKPEVIGTTGIVEDVKPSSDGWLYLVFEHSPESPDCWCFAECRVELTPAPAQTKETT